MTGSPTLASCLSWLERCPTHAKVVGLIPGQGTYLGCRFDPWPKPVSGATEQCFSLTLMFLSLSFSLPLSLKQINISSGEDLEK